MTAKRVLIVANESVGDRPPGVPEVVRRQVQGADEVHVCAPMLTTRLESWASDTDAAASSAHARMEAVLSGIDASGQPIIRGSVGDEDPLQAIADTLATFPADALILASHTPEAQNRHERRLRDAARARFGLSITEMLIDGQGCVVSVEADEHA